MYYVYILSNRNHSTFYVGVTNNLIRRVYQHKTKVVDGFTFDYQVDQLLYYEQYIDVRDALAREKQLKKWHREWKKDLISKFNPAWKDLQEQLGPELS